jgi:hypothetical protein
MRNLTHVYVPVNKNKHEQEFKNWCLERVSSYSTEITWTCERKAMQFLVFTFGDATDALAFKLRFGL